MESFLVCTVLFLALVSLLWKWPGVRRRAWGVAIGVTALTLAGAAAWNATTGQHSASHARLLVDVPKLGGVPDFVSSESCRSCHPGSYATWHATYHRTMTQLATSETVIADFDGVHLTLAGQSYDLERRGEEFWATMPDPAWLLRQQGTPDDPAIPSELPRVERRIVMTTGSHHMQTYWVAAKPGNLLFSFPFTYVRQAERWVPSDETFLRPPGPPQVEFWNNECIKCHAVGGQPGLDRKTQSLTTRVAELGISCEACHGPGEEHVRRNLNPSRRYGYRLGGEPDPSIVNPVDLDSRRSADVCGQCHAVSVPRDPNGWYHTGYPYRVGADLAKTRIVVRHPKKAEMPALESLLSKSPTFLDDRFWADGMIRLAGREYNGLIESPCYQRGELNCLSCHASHASDPVDQLAAGMNTDEACLQCHTDFRERIEAHTHHAPDSSGSRCYNCHMPHTTYGLLKAERSHEIDNPTVAASVYAGRPNACNLCHLDQTLAWTAEHLTEWYGTPPIELTNEQKSIAAAILWILKGDAGQRALLAWHMEWAPALEASGRDWLAPFLAPLLDDPYSAVRYIAHRALRRLPGYADFDYDFLGSSDQRRQASQRALAMWRDPGSRSLDRAGPRLLIDPPARLREAALRELVDRRDERRVDLRE